jgi:cytosine/adenosine deaminase-related metal-dependent hydrolase
VPTLLVKNAAVLVTMDDSRREVPGGGLYAEDGWITEVGPSDELPSTADEVLDLSGHVLLPGLVNTHHHLYQTLTRAVPQAQDVGLFGWLRALYPIWARLTPEAVRAATQLGLVELARSGCTTAFDHQYLFPNGSRLDDQVEAASEIGIRFHASRGSMSLGESDGGLPPDSVVEDEEAILDDCVRVVEAYHDAQPGAMTRVVVAPCSPFSVTPELMRASAALARDLGVQLHTHLAETHDEEEFCVERFGRRPVAYVEELGWAGEDVWYAHGVHVNDEEIGAMAAAGTGVAHCPTSNMLLGSGIAPLRRYREAGVRVGLGVDGSASNDGGHLLAEARQALLAARLEAAPASGEVRLIGVREVLEVATRGGAAVLGRDDVGSLEVGKVCDFFAVDLDRVEYAGALHDRVAAVLRAAPVHVDVNYAHGRAVVRGGEIVTIDVEELIHRHNRLARQLVAG